ncbi:MAG: hypothetical protein IPP14_08070 [Planctomycetes bacterium]|nr:hypothetical protein [Planctomycetota bacterium]
MTPAQARQLFDRALADNLAGETLAAFEQALASDTALCDEFEAFADAQNNAGLAGLDAWLRKAGAQASRQTPLVAAGIAASIASAAQGRRRGRLIRLAVAVSSLAAAAVIAMVIYLPKEAGRGDVLPQTQTSNWPTAQSGQVAVLSEGNLAFENEMDEFTPVPGVRLQVLRGTVMSRIHPSMTMLEGEVTVSLAANRHFEVHVGNHRVVADGPATFTVRAQADAFPEIQHQETFMPRADLLARFGALAFTLTVSAVTGNVDVRAEQASTPLAAGQVQTFQAGPGPGHEGRKPPTPEDAFKQLDKNSDGKLDGDEVKDPLKTDFDDNKDGSISEDEFKAHWKPKPGPGPGPAPKAEDEFKRLDKNNDGQLDDKEADDKFIKANDTDSDGKVSLDEFKKNFKPPMGPGPAPKPEDEFKRLDKNSDGKLDDKEAPGKMKEDFDDDKDGSISEEEFKKHWRPPEGPRPPRPPEGGPEGGPRPPRPPEGGPEGWPASAAPARRRPGRWPASTTSARGRPGRWPAPTASTPSPRR